MDEPRSAEKQTVLMELIKELGSMVSRAEMLNNRAAGIVQRFHGANIPRDSQIQKDIADKVGMGESLKRSTAMLKDRLSELESYLITISEIV